MWHLLEEYIPGFSEVSTTIWIVLAYVCAAIWILNIVAFWRVFEKAGEEGWKSLIPVYNVYTLTFEYLVESATGKDGERCVEKYLITDGFAKQTAFSSDRIHQKNKK